MVAGPNRYSSFVQFKKHRFTLLDFGFSFSVSYRILFVNQS
jgi:hypothetical protein